MLELISPIYSRRERTIFFVTPNEAAHVNTTDFRLSQVQVVFLLP